MSTLFSYSAGIQIINFVASTVIQMTWYNLHQIMI